MCNPDCCIQSTVPNAMPPEADMSPARASSSPAVENHVRASSSFWRAATVQPSGKCSPLNECEWKTSTHAGLYAQSASKVCIQSLHDLKAAVLTDGSCQCEHSYTSDSRLNKAIIGIRSLAPPGARHKRAVGPLHGTLGGGMLPAAPGVLTLQSWPMSLGTKCHRCQAST
jgi:hypothetical protein